MALTSSEVLKELNISRSTFYYWLKNNLVTIPTSPSGRYIWEESFLLDLKRRLQERRAEEEPISEPKFKTTQINNRRYLGNKYKLLGFIKSVVESECTGINTVADIFAGTG